MQPDLSRIISAPGEPALYDVDLDYLFDYHPPTTEERKKKHQEINLAAKTAARSAISAVKAIWGEPEEATSTQSAATDILVNIQTARMFANQLVTLIEEYPQFLVKVEDYEQLPAIEVSCDNADSQELIKAVSKDCAAFRDVIAQHCGHGVLSQRALALIALVPETIQQGFFGDLLSTGE